MRRLWVLKIHNIWSGLTVMVPGRLWAWGSPYMNKERMVGRTQTRERGREEGDRNRIPKGAIMTARSWHITSSTLPSGAPSPAILQSTAKDSVCSLEIVTGSITDTFQASFVLCPQRSTESLGILLWQGGPSGMPVFWIKWRPTIRKNRKKSIPYQLNGPLLNDGEHHGAAKTKHRYWKVNDFFFF